jgi:hypothetical protein
MNKLILFVICLFLFYIGAYGEFVSKITFPQLTVTQQGSTINFGDHQLDYEPGYPMLPVVYYTFLLPPDADLSTVSFRVEGLEERAYTISEPIEPAGPYFSENEVRWPENRRIINGKAVDVYSRNQFYPATHIGIVTKGTLHCYKLVQVRVHLCRYNPVTGRVSAVTNGAISVSVSKAKNSETIVYPVPQSIQKRVQRLAINYTEIAPAYNSKVRVTDNTTYLIAVESEIQSASKKLEAFIESKKNRGYTVKIITEDDWGGGTGSTASDRIRDWLQQNYEELQIEYVLLLGDPMPTDGTIPMRSDSRADAPHDFFYKEMTGDWPNEEGYAELSVGRIPVYDNAGIAKLDKILERIIAYENKPPSEITQWRNNALFAAKPFKTGVADGSKLFEEIKEKYIDDLGWHCYRIYNDDYGNPDESQCTQTAVTNAWNANPYGLMEWHTHGQEESASGIMSVSGVDDLSDANPSFVHMGSCLNAKVENEDNLTYTMLINQSVGAIGGTRVTWYENYNGSWETRSAIQGFILMTARGMIRDSSGIGTSLIDGIAQSDKRHWSNIFGFNLYGCPEVGLYSVKDPTEIKPDFVKNTVPCNGIRFISSLNMLHVKSEQRATLSLCDLSGKTLYTFTANPGLHRYRLPKNMAKGVYIVNLHKNKKGTYNKIIRF